MTIDKEFSDVTAPYLYWCDFTIYVADINAADISVIFVNENENENAKSAQLVTQQKC